MADMLATPEDLASLLQSDLDLSTATLLLETATAIVQEAAGGQRIVQVAGDVITLAGFTDSWLALPQLPVTAVASVALDGITLTAGTDYRLIGDRLWRRTGWQTSYGAPWDVVGQGEQWSAYAPPSLTWPDQEPSTVVVTYTHGYATGHQALQLARAAALALARVGYANPAGVTSERIDDYSVSYDTMAARMAASPRLKAALARQYGRRGGLIRLG